jgi:hypothetical protein
LPNEFSSTQQICAQRVLEMRFKEKELTYAFHPVFDPVAAVNRRVAHVAVQRRLGILSQRWFGSHSADRVACSFASLKIAMYKARFGSHCGLTHATVPPSDNF